MAGQQPTMDQLVQQVLQLGAEDRALNDKLNAANNDIVQLKANGNMGGNDGNTDSKSAWCCFIDK